MNGGTASRRDGRDVTRGSSFGGEHRDGWANAGGRRRIAATALSAAGLVAAVLACVTVEEAWSRARGGAGSRDVLLSATQRRELSDATALQRIHSSYDRAKVRLQRLSTEYTGLGARLQASESRVGQLRTELEDKMREIQRDIHRGSLQLAGGHHTGGKGFTMELAEVPPSRHGREATRLAQQVRELESEVRRLDAKEVQQATELDRMRRGMPAAAEEGAWQGTFAAKRAMGTEQLGSLARLKSINLQLEAENRRICELCAQSAMLRLNRQQTCSICAHYAPLEDTELEAPFQAQKSSTPSLAGRAINRFVSGWKPAKAADGAGLRAEASGNTRAEMQSAVQVMYQGVQGVVGTTVAHLFSVAPQQQQLVQIDDRDHMGLMGGGPLVTAVMEARGKKLLVGTCAPSPEEVKFSPWESICNACKSQLGADVERMGHAIRCEHPG
jgi:hypothetical protein